MGDLLIRNLADATLLDLNRRAEANHTSPEEEARRLLEKNASAPFDYDSWLAKTRALRASIARGDGVSTTDILRNMRYGDERL